jgi:nucleotide-binding universal stress UspA family protein
MKFLVGYDGSHSAADALNTAIAYAKGFKAKIVVVTSLYGGREDSREKFIRAEKQLQDAQSRIQKEGLACETHILVRALAPGEDVVSFAEEHRIDHIFIGVKRRSRVGKMVFGSNAQFIILNAPCPVVTVR